MVEAQIASDRRIQYVKQQRQGPAAARNKGLLHAHGKYIAFLDSDDYFTPEHLSERLALFEADPALDLIYGDAEVIGETEVACHEDPRLIVSVNHPGVRIGGTFTLKTSSLIRLGGFPAVPYGEDSRLFSAAERAGFKITKCPKVTYCYDRTQLDSITVSKLKKKTVA